MMRGEDGNQRLTGGVGRDILALIGTGEARARLDDGGGLMRREREWVEVFVPDGTDVEGALARTTHLAIGAHQDDLEIMAYDGIMRCFRNDGLWFCGVVMTDGSGSPRDGLYADYTDEQMKSIRRKEQKKAAIIGEYGAQVLLDYPSSAVKESSNRAPVEDLEALLRKATPQVVYTHNLADKHDTHVATALRVIEALRGLPAAERPERVYGCEVWRSLDWLVDADKVAFDVTSHENLQRALLGVFDSQVSGGKRYDLATMGRRRANATYYASHDVDVAERMIYAVDLTPLIDDPSLDVGVFVQALIDRLRQDVVGRVERLR
jgi:LmbE family N-acetylglucosaminyl deacetylase